MYFCLFEQGTGINVNLNLFLYGKSMLAKVVLKPWIT